MRTYEGAEEAMRESVRALRGCGAMKTLWRGRCVRDVTASEAKPRGRTWHPEGSRAAPLPPPSRAAGCLLPPRRALRTPTPAGAPPPPTRPPRRPMAAAACPARQGRAPPRRNRANATSAGSVRQPGLCAD